MLNNEYLDEINAIVTEALEKPITRDVLNIIHLELFKVFNKGFAKGVESGIRAYQQMIEGNRNSTINDMQSDIRTSDPRHGTGL